MDQGGNQVQGGDVGCGQEVRTCWSFCFGEEVVWSGVLLDLVVKTKERERERERAGDKGRTPAAEIHLLVLLIQPTGGAHASFNTLERLIGTHADEIAKTSHHHHMSQSR